MFHFVKASFTMSKIFLWEEGKAFVAIKKKKKSSNSLQIIAAFHLRKNLQKQSGRMTCDCFPLERLGSHLPVYRSVLKGPGKPAEFLKSPISQNTSSTLVSVNLALRQSKLEHLFVVEQHIPSRLCSPAWIFPREMTTAQTSMKSKNWNKPIPFTNSE